MTISPGRLLGVGRRADVYELPGGQVLRRYRDPAMTTEREARLMTYLSGAGMPVPLVHDSEGPDIIMDRVMGSTMLTDLTSHPWRLERHARTLAAIHRQLHGIAAPDWLPASNDTGRCVVHRDLHPDNVMLGPDGPVVIDWQGAARGEADDDTATAWVIMRTAEVPGPRLQRTVGTLGQQLFAARFRAACGSIAPSAVQRAVAMRVADDTTTTREHARLRKLAARA